MKTNLSMMAERNFAILLAVLLAGCQREQTQVYNVPKDKEPEQKAPEQALVQKEPDQTVSSKPVNWTTPSDWQEHPGEGMRLASFTVLDKSGRAAEVTIIPMSGRAGTTAGNVNRWRSQVNLGPLAEQEISKQLVNVDIGRDQGQLYDVTSTEPILDKKSNARIIAAILSRGDTTFFFKMTGMETLVQEQKPAFLQFLKSISFQTAEAQLPANHPALSSGAATPVAAGDSATHPNWQVPANWHEAPSSPMLVAKFTVPGPGDAHADVNVSSSQGTGGGIAANINRWRGQLGLAPVEDQAAMDKLVSAVSVGDNMASCVDMAGSGPGTGKATRLVAIIVPRDGETWFYKLMGDAGVVEKEKPAFVQFVQTVKYQNAL